MQFYIFTDIPVWVRPLARALEARGADSHSGDEAGAIRPGDCVINRSSTRVARKAPARAQSMQAALQHWEDEGRRVVNGARTLELGFSKWAQVGCIRSAGLAAPRTASLSTGQRQLADRAVLLKPPAGGFGRGIQRLEIGQPLPEPPPPGDWTGWVEQELIQPADGAVHRIECLGGQPLYEASSPIRPECFDYCLAHADSKVTLRPGSALPVPLADAVKRLLRAASMELGSVEYLIDDRGQPQFIDLNPVSSLHPGAKAVLDVDPLERIADYLIEHREHPPSGFAPREGTKN